MTQPDHDAIVKDAFETVQRARLARRILPEHLKVYVSDTDVDWLGLVERVERPSRYHWTSNVRRCPQDDDLQSRAAVAIVAHLLGFAEALRVGPADTFMENLALLDRERRVEVIGELTLLHAIIDL